MNPPPLSGVRVLDCGIITAGAATSAILADAGAEVLKIESLQYQDPFRFWFGTATAETTTSSAFDCNNRNKRGVGLNLKHPRGRELFLRLVAQSDVIVENFRRGVMERLNLGYEALQAANERIVLASISVQGVMGPKSHISSYGSTLEAMGGLAAITGSPDGPPLTSGRNVNFPDQAVSIFAAGAIVAAVVKARRDGKGAHIDLPQRELTAFLVGDVAAQEKELDAFDPAWRKGNADPQMVLQGCFLAVDDWVAIALSDPEALSKLERMIEFPAHVNALTIEAKLSTWVAHKDAAEVVSLLRAAGLFAAVVPHAESLLPTFTGKSTSPFVASTSGRLVKGCPFQIRGLAGNTRRDAPRLGEHTSQVLTELLALSPEEMVELAAEGAIDVELSGRRG